MTFWVAGAWAMNSLSYCLPQLLSRQAQLQKGFVPPLNLHRKDGCITPQSLLALRTIQNMASQPINFSKPQSAPWNWQRWVARTESLSRNEHAWAGPQFIK